MQEPGKFNLKISVTPNGLEKYLSLSINDKLHLLTALNF